jgi:hypothetical protein
MKKIKLVISIFAVMAMIGTASAERVFAEIYKECGLGAMFFPSDPIIAVITNVTWDLGTTAVSSELTSPASCSGDSSMMAAFLLNAHPQVEQDLAVGEGPYLSSMVSLMDCKGNETAATLALREQFSSVTSNEYFNGSKLEKSGMLFDMAALTSDQACTI